MGAEVFFPSKTSSSSPSFFSEQTSSPAENIRTASPRATELTIMAAEEAGEDPFELIKKGNAFEAASDHWRSAEFYSRASVCLRLRADDLSSQIRNNRLDGGAAEDAEKRKVVSLFRAQSLEYLYKARHCLMEALRFENDQDRSRTVEVAKSGSGSLDPLFSMITPAESEKRKETFERLFSGGSGESVECEINHVPEVGIQTEEAAIECADDGREEMKEGGGDDEGNTSSVTAPIAPIDYTNENNVSGEASPTTAEDEIDNRQQSLESRLAKLDTSLLPKVPPPFISGSRYDGGGGNSTKDRLQEIQRGLRGLGVSLPDNSRKKDLIPENLSSEDQVKLIIQQAQDEVRVEKGKLNGEGGESNGLQNTSELDEDLIDENDSMFEGYEDDDDLDVDALLAKAENLVAKTGINAGGEGKFSPELVQIRKVQALLLEARLCLEMVQAKSSDNEDALTNNSKEAGDDDGNEDMSDGVSADPVESGDSTNLAARKKAQELIKNAHELESGDSTNLAARKKAQELIKNAHECMKKLLEILN